MQKRLETPGFLSDLLCIGIYKLDNQDIRSVLLFQSGRSASTRSGYAFSSGCGKRSWCLSCNRGGAIPVPDLGVVDEEPVVA
jgi:hypothetical protein